MIIASFFVPPTMRTLRRFVPTRRLKLLAFPLALTCIWLCGLTIKTWDYKYIHQDEATTLATRHIPLQDQIDIPQLGLNIIPRTVFYVWCGFRFFQFHHYISMLSAIQELRPDSVVFYYNIRPGKDPQHYYIWFEEILDKHPLINSIESHEACQDQYTINFQFVKHTLYNYGGIFANENTIFTNFSKSLYKYAYIDGFNDHSKEGFLASMANVSLLESDVVHVQGQVARQECVTFQTYILKSEEFWCLTVDPLYFPKDIWHLDHKFGSLIRTIFYGSPDIPVARKYSIPVVPNIAHVVWIGGGEMDYLFYLCILSLIYVAEVDKVYLHGDTTPHGPLWDKVKNDSKLKFVYRMTPKLIYGSTVNVTSHISDIYRVDIMLRYGGIYVDTDAIFVKKIGDEIRCYEAVASYDWYQWPSFPDAINFGVTLGMRGAEFWQRFRDSMRWFIDSDWSWNGLRQPYHILERHPDLLKIEPHLQVICFMLKCHPTWWGKYHDKTVNHDSTNSLANWKNDAYAYHFTHPTPKELSSEEDLLASSGLFAEMGRHILSKAGRIKDSHRLEMLANRTTVPIQLASAKPTKFVQSL